MPLTQAATRAKHVALFVTGGIAAYKACEVLRGLQKQGVDVRVCMSESATRLVAPRTFEALSGHRVTLDRRRRSPPSSPR